VGEETLAHIFEPPLLQVPFSLEAAGLSAHVIAVVLSFILITYLHILLGEQVPKMMALNAPETTAIVAAQPIQIIAGLFRPFIALLYGSTDLVLGLMRIKWHGEHSLVHSSEELEMMITASKQAGVLEPQEEEMLHRVFDFAELSASEVMLPRTAMVCIPIGATPNEALRTVEESGHTRFPVYERDIDHVVGMVHSKDIYRLSRQHSAFSIREALRPIIAVPETADAGDVLLQMKRRRSHLALVFDEYGGTAGLITLSDLMEHVVGAVQDEFEAPAHPDFSDQADGSVLIDGLVLTREVNDRYDLKLDEADYDTIGGFVFGQLGRRPQVDDEVSVLSEDGAPSVRLAVDQVDGLRVSRVRLAKLEGALPSAADGPAS
jgi:CBS domain containing-hemolysin-like protein